MVLEQLYNHIQKYIQTQALHLSQKSTENKEQS